MPLSHPSPPRKAPTLAARAARAEQANERAGVSLRALRKQLKVSDNDRSATVTAERATHNSETRSGDDDSVNVDGLLLEDAERSRAHQAAEEDAGGEVEVDLSFDLFD